MSDINKAPAQKPKPKRDRSPAFPFIPLKTAIARLEAFETTFRRHPAPAKHSGQAWGMKGWTSQAQQTLAALKSFGLIEYNGSGESLEASISEDGRAYLRAQQESIKKDVLKRCALRPKTIASMYQIWGADRPPDAVCLDHLVFKASFNEAGAKIFLHVYDETIAYAGLSDSDKLESDDTSFHDEVEDPDVTEQQIVQASAPAPQRGSTPPHTAYQDGGRREVITLDEGDVVISFPDGLSAASVADLSDHLELFIRKAQRRAGVEKLEKKDEAAH